MFRPLVMNDIIAMQVGECSRVDESDWNPVAFLTALHYTLALSHFMPYIFYLRKLFLIYLYTSI